MALTKESIERRFVEGRAHYLTAEEAVCYVASALTLHDSYGTLLINSLDRDERKHQLRISDTVLYKALKFLESNDYIFGYWWHVEGRARPRRMYRITDDNHVDIITWCNYWRGEYGAVKVSTDDLRSIAGCNPHNDIVS